MLPDPTGNLYFIAGLISAGRHRPDDARPQIARSAVGQTIWVYLEVVRDKTAKRAAAFLRRLVAKAPFRIVKLLTDNGKEFTDRFVATGEREPTGQHEFDRECAKHAIEHRLIEPRHPQTNGMVERFNGRIGDILQTTRFDSAEDLRQTLERYNRVYNQHIPQRALGHVAPIAALKQWQNKKPDLFNKAVYDLPGLDTYTDTLSDPRLVTLTPVVFQTFVDAAFARAETGMKLPDAIHVATALQTGCHVFLTDDKGIRTPKTLPIVALSDL